MTDISLIPLTFLTLLRDETCEGLAAKFIIMSPKEAFL